MANKYLAQEDGPVLGQDMPVGFIGPEEGAKVAFSISESVALRIRQPRSICVLTE